MNDDPKGGTDSGREQRPAWLDAQLRTLPKEIPPELDLWPAIAQRIRARSPRWIPAAVAASVVMSAVAVNFAWQSYRATRLTDEALAVLAQVREPYQSARLEFAADWSTVRAQVDPEVALVIDRNLAIIRASVHELDQALMRAPDDAALRGLFQSTLASEIDLYRRARHLVPSAI